MNRFQFALKAADGPKAVTLPELADGLVAAISAAEAEGLAAGEDPAVLVIGSFIAFHTHADINTIRGYRDLLSLCEQRLDAVRAMQN
jgi:hypothetical protein